jgi:hypothetical protein
MTGVRESSCDRRADRVDAGGASVRQSARLHVSGQYSAVPCQRLPSVGLPPRNAGARSASLSVQVSRGAQVDSRSPPSPLLLNWPRAGHARDGYIQRQDHSTSGRLPATANSTRHGKCSPLREGHGQRPPHAHARPRPSAASARPSRSTASSRKGAPLRGEPRWNGWAIRGAASLLGIGELDHSSSCRRQHPAADWAIEAQRHRRCTMMVLYETHCALNRAYAHVLHRGGYRCRQWCSRCGEQVHFGTGTSMYSSGRGSPVLGGETRVRTQDGVSA